MLLMLSCFVVTAQQEVTDTLQFRFYFKQGKAVVDPSYCNNGARLSAFVDSIRRIDADSARRLVAVSVECGASPEGRYDMNERLARSRAQNLGSYLIEASGLSPDVLKAYSIGVNWRGLVKLLEKSDIEHRDTLISIIDTSLRQGVDAVGRLRKVDGGRSWQWMLEHLFPELRHGSTSVTCYVASRMPHSGAAMPVPSVVVMRDTIVAHDTVYIANSPVEAPEAANADDALPYRRKLVAALRTNMLLPLLNAGVEVTIGNRWSVGFDWYYPWLWREWHKSTKMERCFELLLGGAEARYWLGSRHTPGEDNWKYRLTGHSVGAYVYGGYFDIGKNFEGRQGEFFNIGLDYLYSINVGKRLKIEFSVGVGFIHSSARKYKVYNEDGKAFRTGVTERVNWFGPTKATVSLVVPLYRKVRKEVPAL